MALDAPLVNKIAIGRKIRAAREALNLTQLQLAIRMNMSESTVSRHEDGERSIRLEDMPQWCQALRVRPEYFFSSDDDDAVLEAERIAQGAFGFLRGASPKVSKLAIKRLAEMSEQGDDEAGSTVGKKA